MVELKGLLHQAYIDLFTKVKPSGAAKLRQKKIGNFLFIEQDQGRDTKTAELSRAGHKIMWVVDTRNNRYLACVDNGKTYFVNQKDYAK